MLIYNITSVINVIEFESARIVRTREEIEVICNGGDTYLLTCPVGQATDSLERILQGLILNKDYIEIEC